MLIKQLKDEYLRVCEFERKLSPNTVISYSTTLRDFTQYVESAGCTHIEQITKKELHAYIQELNAALKASSVLQEKAILHAFFEYAVEGIFGPFCNLNFIFLIKEDYHERIKNRSYPYP